MNNPLLKKIFALAIIAVFAIGPIGTGYVLAANALTDKPESYTPLAPLPDLNTLQPKLSVDFKSYVTYAFNLLIAVGAVAAVFMITWGGFEYMTTDAVQGKSDGLKKIQNAIYGLILILSSYLILRTVDPRFVDIPDTLVPHLPICSTAGQTDCIDDSKNKLSNWQDTMNQLSAQFQQQSQQDLINKTQAIAEVKDLQKQLDEAKSVAATACANGNDSTKECTDANLNVKIIQDKFNIAKADSLFKTFKGLTSTIRTELSSGGGVIDTNGKNVNTQNQSTLDQLTIDMKANDDAYSKALTGIKNIGGNEDVLQNLTNEYNTTKGILVIQQIYTAYKASNCVSGCVDKALKSAQSSQKEYLSSLASSPDLQATLKKVTDGYINDLDSVSKGN